MEITINASSLEDIDPSAIGQRLTNGTAVVASPVLSRLKTREEENADVVGRVARRNQSLCYVFTAASVNQMEISFYRRFS